MCEPTTIRLYYISQRNEADTYVMGNRTVVPNGNGLCICDLYLPRNPNLHTQMYAEHDFQAID